MPIAREDSRLQNYTTHHAGIYPPDKRYKMALSNFGSLFLNLLIFITTLVNFSFALTSMEPLVLIALYGLSKLFLTAPEEGIFGTIQQRDIYSSG